MEKTDVEKLFTLLGCFYPNARQLRDKNMQMAWCLALEPYAYEDAKAAVAAYARKNKFFPDIVDITGQLPDPAADTPEENREKWPVICVTPYLQKLAERQANIPAWALALSLVGLRTWPVARADGMSWPDWVKAHDEAAKQLPPTWSALKQRGLTYAESGAAMKQAWTDFWAAHGETDRGIP